MSESRSAVRRAADLARFLDGEAAAADETRAVTRPAWDALRASGLLLAPFPRGFGGEGIGLDDHHRDLFDVLRTLGGADLSVGRLYEGHVNAIHLVARYGSRSQVADFATAVRTGALSAVWGAEGARPLRALREGAMWRLEGGKILASGAGLVTRPLVPVATEAGQVLMLLDLPKGERADLSGWTAQGMRSSATGSIDLTGLVVPPEAIVGEPGDFMRQPAFSGGAWRFCAVHLGAAERLVDLFRAHLVSRGRGDDPYQLQRIAQATTAVVSARMWVADAAKRLAAAEGNAQEIAAFANLTRGVTEQAALDVLELVHRGIGLQGFIRPHPVERISRDLATYLRQPVPDLAMADAARAVLASDRATADLWDER